MLYEVRSALAGQHSGGVDLGGQPDRGQNLCSTSTARPGVLTVSLTARVSRSGWSRSLSSSSLQGPPYSFGRIHLTGREWALNRSRNESSERDRPRSSWPGIPFPFRKTPSERSCPAS